MVTPSKLRTVRFSLQTLFVLVTLAACVCGWLAYSFNWIRQRHEVLTHWRAYDDERAPGGLWLLGEPGHDTLRKFFIAEEEIASPEEIARVRQLFPEAAQVYSAPVPR